MRAGSFDGCMERSSAPSERYKMAANAMSLLTVNFVSSLPGSRMAESGRLTTAFLAKTEACVPSTFAKRVACGDIAEPYTFLP